jgi:acyl carrier protein
MNTSQTEVFDKVKSITAQYLGVAKENITKETSFMNDLGADSFDAIELTLALEDKFGIEISDNDAKKLKTVGDLVGFIL